MIKKTKQTTSGLRRRVQAPPISVRLPPADDAYYREQAKLANMSISAFVTRRLMAGVVNETAQEYEDRIRQLTAEITAIQPPVYGGVDRATQLSLFTCEALLTAIVQAQNPKTVQAAQDAAKARLLKVRGET